MNAEALQGAIEEMREYIQGQVAAGFNSEEDIQSFAMERLELEDDAEAIVLRRHAALLTREEIEEHLKRQMTWPPCTDCDRLDAAFADLEQAGIVARQDFSCCGNCASGEIWEVMEAQAAQGIQVRGYVYYHMQDTEAAVAGGGVYLGYGSTKRDDASVLEIAREIVVTLQRHGLTVEWDGTRKKRILVLMQWQRRRRNEAHAQSGNKQPPRF